MGFLDRAIRRGISEGVGKAVGGAIEKAVAPKAEQLANQTAQHLDQAARITTQQTAQTAQTASGFSGAFANLQRAAEGYATEMSKNMKICPACEQPAGADQKFCPVCGAKLPETTIAQGAVCPSCGKQNTIGTKFCSDCGTKLPAAVQEEQAAQAKSDAAFAQSDQLLPQYPKWRFGGKDFNIEQYDGYILFAVKMENSFSAQNAVKQYRELLLQSGFRQAGEYPVIEHLYKMLNGVCYHCDTEHCFEGDSDYPTLYFNIGEPTGGFDYVKPAPKKSSGIFDLFK